MPDTSSTGNPVLIPNSVRAVRGNPEILCLFNTCRRASVVLLGTFFSITKLVKSSMIEVTLSSDEDLSEVQSVPAGKPNSDCNVVHSTLSEREAPIF